MTLSAKPSANDAKRAELYGKSIWQCIDRRVGHLKRRVGHLKPHAPKCVQSGNMLHGLWDKQSLQLGSQEWFMRATEPKSAVPVELQSTSSLGNCRLAVKHVIMNSGQIQRY